MVAVEKHRGKAVQLQIYTDGRETGLTAACWLEKVPADLAYHGKALRHELKYYINYTSITPENELSTTSQRTGTARQRISHTKPLLDVVSYRAFGKDREFRCAEIPVRGYKKATWKYSWSGRKMRRLISKQSLSFTRIVFFPDPQKGHRFSLKMGWICRRKCTGLSGPECCSRRHRRYQREVSCSMKEYVRITFDHICRRESIRAIFQSRRERVMCSHPSLWSCKSSMTIICLPMC